MQRLEVSGAVRPIYGSLGVKRLTKCLSYFLLNAEGKKLGNVEFMLMFHLNMHYDRFLSPRKEKFYGNISFSVQKFIMVYHINKSENLSWATPKHQLGPSHKTGKIRKLKRRFFEEFYDTKQEYLPQKARKLKNSFLHVVEQAKCNINLQKRPECTDKDTILHLLTFSSQ